MIAGNVFAQQSGVGVPGYNSAVLPTDVIEVMGAISGSELRSVRADSRDFSPPKGISKGDTVSLKRDIDTSAYYGSIRKDSEVRFVYDLSGYKSVDQRFGGTVIVYASAYGPIIISKKELEEADWIGN